MSVQRQSEIWPEDKEMKFMAVIVSYTIFPLLEFLMGVHSNFPVCCSWEYVKNGSLSPNKNTAAWWHSHISKADFGCGYLPCSTCRKEHRFVARDKLVNCDNCTSLYCKVLNKTHNIVIGWLYDYDAILIPCFGIDEHGNSTFLSLYKKSSFKNKNENAI